ncbi:MAG: NrfD/PsrC family molybdoenzyme membrane anchor subunit [Chloroflexota bacterium]|nr:NrfD/PsrC family molybdoenzyme membrane anchor subunit [Chloroflexota bacterium]
MELNFVTIEGKSKGYKITIGILAAITLIGLLCFGISYYYGHSVFGSSNVIPWGMPIVLAIYFIGLSAGSLILSTLVYVFGQEQYKPIGRMAVLLAIVLIFGAMISIAVDLGRPENFWRLFMFFYWNNMTSMFAVNGILYGGYFVISIAYMGIILSGSKVWMKRWGCLAIGWAALVHMGTGAIFGFMAAKEAWFSPVKPFEFLTAAITSGIALLIVVMILTMKFTGRDIKKDIVLSLGRLLTVSICVLTTLIFIDKLTHIYAPERAAAMYSIAGPYSWIFWGCQIGLVVIVPLVILFNRKLRTVKWTGLASLSVVVGIFFERYFLVIPQAGFPQHYYPGHIEGVYGAIGSFVLTPAEMGMSIGIATCLGLLFMLGLKFMKTLPEKTEEELVVAAAKLAPPQAETPADASASSEAETSAEVDQPEPAAPETPAEE